MGSGETPLTPCQSATSHPSRLFLRSGHPFVSLFVLPLLRREKININLPYFFTCSFTSAGYLRSLSFICIISSTFQPFSGSDSAQHHVQVQHPASASTFSTN